eukprot:g1317.t1
MAKRLFGEKVAKDIQFGLRMPKAHIGSICKVALQFCSKGKSEALVSKCAKKFQIDEDIVYRAVNGISQMFMLATKQNITPNALNSSLRAEKNVDEEIVGIITEFYGENSEQIEACLERMVIHLPEYKDLDWRLDMELSKRTLHGRMEPHFTMQLDTLDAGRDGGVSRRYLEIDFAHLKLLHSSLTAAVKERESVHVERMKRYIQ